MLMSKDLRLVINVVQDVELRLDVEQHPLLIGGFRCSRIVRYTVTYPLVC